MDLRTAGVIVIGDEVLRGQVKDENTHFLAQRFHALGVKLCKISIIADSIEAIAKEVSEFSHKYNIVITTGGIGPTHDDVTYEGIAKAFQEPLVLNEELVNFWNSLYRSNSASKSNPVLKMARVPKSASIVYSNVARKLISKFPIVVISNIYVFPGVPTYLQASFRGLEKDHFEATNKFHATQLFLNVDESTAVPALDETVKAYEGIVDIGSYPILGNNFYRTKITLESTSPKVTEEANAFLKARLQKEWIVPDADLVCNAGLNLSSLISMKKFDQENFTKLVNSSVSIRKVVKSMASQSIADDLFNSSSKYCVKKVPPRSCLQVIQQCFQDYEVDQVFLSFNGGKDCTALLHLVHSVLNQTYAGKVQPQLQAAYFRGENPFPEVEEFIKTTASRYNLELVTISGPIKPSLAKLLSERPNLKAVFMGQRKTDPNSENLKPYQETDCGWPKIIRVNPLLDWTYSDVWKLIQELKIPYCSLYDQGNLQSPLKEAAKVSEEMAFVLGLAFGPKGRGILCQKMGAVTISRSGYDILSKVFDRSESPVVDYIIVCVRDIHSSIGDGVKTFVILLSSLLKEAVAKDISKIRSEIKMFKKELDLVCTEISSFAVNDLNLIIGPFFLTRFTKTVCEFISHLFQEWVNHNSNNVDNVYEYLIDNFNTLCTADEGSKPLFESNVEKGIRIDGEFYGNFSLNPTECILKVMYVSEDSDKSDEVILIDARCLLEEVKDVQPRKELAVLVITNANLPGNVKLLFRKERILVLHRAPIEDTKFLYEFELSYRALKKTSLEVTFCRQTTKHKTSVFISLDIYCLRITSPTTHLKTLYIESIKNCLHLCKMTLDYKSLIVPAGKFEYLFSVFLSIIFNGVDSVPISNRDELDHWESTKKDILHKISVFTLCSSAERDDQFGFQLEGVLLNLIIKLRERIKSDCDVRLFSESLMNVSRNLSFSSDKGFEALQLKLTIVQKALSAFLFLINVDDVLQGTEKFRLKYL